MSGENYILDKDNNPVLEPDYKKYGEWMQAGENRRLGIHRLPGDIRVSTVFLGLDHGWDDRPPVLWETMVFGGKYDQEQERYTTYMGAIEGHRKWVRLVEESVSSKAAEAPGGQDCDCVIEIDSSGTATVIHQAGCRYSQLYEAFRRACEQVWRCTDAPGQTLESTMQFYLAAPDAPSERGDELRKSKELHEAWQAWLEQHGVPISMEFVRLANAVGEFTELARAGLSSQEGK